MPIDRAQDPTASGWDVWLIRFEHGADPIGGLRATFGISAEHASELEMTLPRAVKRGVARERAERFEAALRGIGGVVEIRPSRPRSSRPPVGARRPASVEPIPLEASPSAPPPATAPMTLDPPGPASLPPRPSWSAGPGSSRPPSAGPAPASSRPPRAAPEPAAVQVDDGVRDWQLSVLKAAAPMLLGGIGLLIFDHLVTRRSIWDGSGRWLDWLVAGGAFSLVLTGLLALAQLLREPRESLELPKLGLVGFVLAVAIDFWAPMAPDLESLEAAERWDPDAMADEALALDGETFRTDQVGGRDVISEISSRRLWNMVRELEREGHGGLHFVGAEEGPGGPIWAGSLLVACTAARPCQTIVAETTTPSGVYSEAGERFVWFHLD